MIVVSGTGLNYRCAGLSHTGLFFLSEIFTENMTFWLLLKSPTWQQSSCRELQLLPYTGYVFTRSLLALKLLSLTETSLIDVTCQAPLGI